jgi:hypothetical protein
MGEGTAADVVGVGYGLGVAAGAGCPSQGPASGAGCGVGLAPPASGPLTPLCGGGVGELTP